MTHDRMKVLKTCWLATDSLLSDCTKASLRGLGNQEQNPRATSSQGLALTGFNSEHTLWVRGFAKSELL
jgi:hypothetical protein